MSLLALVLNNYLLMGIAAGMFGLVTASAFTQRHTFAAPVRKYQTPELETRRDLLITRTLSSERVFENGEIDVTLNIQCRTRDTGLIELRDTVPEQTNIVRGSNYVYLNMTANTQASIRYTIQCPLMGPYTIGPVSLRTSDVSNLFYSEEHVEVYTDLLVLPGTVQIKDLKISSRVPKMYTGRVSIKQPGPGYEFYSLREYQPGDPFKDINWKAFCKTRKLMVNEREREAISDITIVLDSRAIASIGQVSNNPLLWGARAAASLSTMFLKRRDSVGLVIYDEAIHLINHGAGEGQLLKLLIALSGSRPYGELSSLAVAQVVLPHIPPRSTIIMISNLDGDETIRDTVREICARDFNLILLSPTTLDIELALGKITRTHYNLLKAKRQNLSLELTSYGVRFIDWPLNRPLLEVLEVEAF